MRTPANSTKHFMNEIVTAMNSFFTKLTKNQIQFQLSEHYALPKKSQTGSKLKHTKKIAKVKTQISPEKLKLLKKAFKKFRDSLLSDDRFKTQTKELNQKQVNKKLKNEWKKLTDEQQSKWCESSQKKQAAAKKKSTQAKSSQKPKQNSNGKQQRPKQEKADE